LGRRGLWLMLHSSVAPSSLKAAHCRRCRSGFHVLSGRVCVAPCGLAPANRKCIPRGASPRPLRDNRSMCRRNSSGNLADQENTYEQHYNNPVGGVDANRIS